jgi:hypothetical protein
MKGKLLIIRNAHEITLASYPLASGTTAWMQKVEQRMEQLPRGLGIE